MKVLILNGSLKGDSSLALLEEVLVKELEERGWDVSSILLSEKKIANCMGCFGCWIKTPGQCVIKDFGRQIPEMMINSELVISLSPVTFGGFSSEMKKAMDRIIPLMMPYFVKIDGEIHHQARYERYPSLMNLGGMPASCSCRRTMRRRSGPELPGPLGKWEWGNDWNEQGPSPGGEPEAKEEHIRVPGELSS